MDVWQQRAQKTGERDRTSTEAEMGEGKEREGRETGAKEDTGLKGLNRSISRKASLRHIASMESVLKMCPVFPPQHIDEPQENTYKSPVTK